MTKKTKEKVTLDDIKNGLIVTDPSKEKMTCAIHSVTEIAEAIIRNYGNLSATARELGIHRHVLESRIKNHPELKEVTNQSRDEFIDLCEEGLLGHVKGKSLSAIMFTLRTIGKARGWGETPMVINQNANMNIDMKKLEAMPMEERMMLDELLSKLVQDEDPE